MFIRLNSLLLIQILLLVGCSTKNEQQNQRRTSNHYAKGFRIEETDNYQQLTVFNPWEKAQNISVEYFLVGKNEPVPDSISGRKIIRTPVERVICMSTTHLAFLDVLDETGAVVGISGKQYVSNEKIRQEMSEGNVVDVGYGQNLNYELIVARQPELVMVYGIGSEVTGYVRKLEELGIPVVMVAEYLEESPLGKAEWIKFIGALFDKKSQAEKYFSEIEQQYRKLKKLAAGQTNHPKVLVGSPYKDSWWVPGANSYMANLIEDAGGDYLGKKNQSHESYVVSFEQALTWGNKADVWINMGNLSSKPEILSTDQRFENFGVFKRGKVFNNIKGLSKHGGNDFWESGTVHPNLVLHDLITIFYPQLTNGQMYYYQEIK